MSVPPQLIAAVKVALIDKLARPIIDASAENAKVATGKFARRRANKLRRIRDEKNGIDNSGNA